ncbi:MAG: hypothetical protein OXI25_03445 [Chloroflexota bacterium]|nr:hypothetical protein [Chloroflexota bacterium]
MFIMDYEAAVTVVDADGRRHRATLSGLVEPDNPARAGLGHSPTDLASQEWRALTLAFEAQPAAVGRARIIFADGSERGAQLSPREGDPAACDVALTEQR